MDQEETHATADEARASMSVSALKKKKKRSKSGRHRHRHRQEDVFNIPGVLKIAISAKSQKFLGCVVGDTITAEKPWKVVKKEMFEDHIEVYDEDSEFLPLKEQITQFPKEEMLFGYVPDESREYDEFYLCLTEEAHDKVAEIIAKMEKELEQKLNNAIYKQIRPWVSQGTEEEVDDEIIKNNRPLLEVEVETDYPIMNPKIKFKMRKVEDARDGYAQIVPSARHTYVHVQRRRINAATQVSALVRSNEAQTICTFPSNAYSQYEYEYTFDEKPSEECKQRIHEYLTENADKLSDLLEVNGSINFYVNDYIKLGQGESKKPSMDDLIEYISFTEINLCKGKMVSYVAFHPMWSGTAAVSYVDESPLALRKGPPVIDEVSRAVYGINPVLLWSFKDGLSPKLILEAHREVIVLSFCPYDENILIGGCVSGQILIWDIRNKLQNVEEEEILTDEQQKYRSQMYSLMKWMKNIKDIKLVHAAAVSKLEYSHNAIVTQIVWIPPYWEVTKTGQLNVIPEDSEQRSFQFVTSSEDGTILFWDLLAKPVVQAGSYRPHRRLRRLKKRPSALTIDVSPFRSLNRLLMPCYKLFVKHPPKEDKPLSVICMDIRTPKMEYEEVNPDPNRVYSKTERVMHRPVQKRSSELPKCEFCGGSPEGDFMIGSWEGYDYNTGELINSQVCKIQNLAKYHDGPVTSVSRFVSGDILLSVGGKVFAIWKEDFPQQPILWRRSRKHYTFGVWNLFRPGMFKLTRSDGHLEMWLLASQSDNYILAQTVSGHLITGAYTHPIKAKDNFLGIAEENGSLRIFYVPDLLQEQTTDDEAEVTYKFFEKEVQRKRELIAWQEDWMNKHASWIKKQREEALLEQQRKAKEEKEEMEKQEEAQAALEKEEVTVLAKEHRASPGKYGEWAREQWNKKEEERLTKLLLAKKRLNRDDLEKQHTPIKKYEEEKAKKKQKQEEIQSQAQEIFHDTVAMLFPDIMLEKPAPPPDPYAGGDSTETKREQFNRYKGMTKGLEEYVEQHTFEYKFDWKDILRAGRERRRLLGGYRLESTHKNRHLMYKLSRKAYEEEQERTAQREKAEEEARKAREAAAAEMQSQGENQEEEDDGMMDYGVILPEE